MSKIVWNVQLKIEGYNRPIKTLLENYGAKDVPELLEKAKKELEDPGVYELLSFCDWDFTDTPRVSLEE